MIKTRNLMQLTQTTKVYVKSLSRMLIPEQPTWDLMNNCSSGKVEIDIGKLERLSLITIDADLTKKLANVVDIVERMCQLDIEANVKPLVYFKHLGFCPLRDDSTKLNKNPCQYAKNDIVGNAKTIYDDYFIAPNSHT